MASLCSACGCFLCKHTAKERDQTQEDFKIDRVRFMTPEERTAWQSLASLEVCKGIAAEIQKQRRAGTFKPEMPRRIKPAYY